MKDLLERFSRRWRSPFSPGEGEKVADRPVEGGSLGSDVFKSFTALPRGAARACSCCPAGLMAGDSFVPVACATDWIMSRPCF